MPEDLKVRVAPTNAEQLAAWDGDEGEYWAANADHYDRAVAGYHRSLLDAADIDDGDRVLDLGCGSGQTTRDAVRATASGSAVGVDLSTRLLDLARARALAEGLDNVRFEHADVQVHPFDPGAYDVAISRTGSMFFGDPAVAFTNVARALRPGARMVQLTWQPAVDNEWLPALAGALAVGRDLPLPPPGAPGPFALSEPDRVRALLGDAGFVDVDLEPLTADMWFGTDADDGFRFVLGQLGWMLQDLDAGDRVRAETGLRETIAAHTTDKGVLFGSAAWLIRAVRP